MYALILTIVTSRDRVKLSESFGAGNQELDIAV